MGDPDEAINWLVSDPRNLCLGATRQSAVSELIEECSPGCSTELFKSLESATLEHWPSWEGQDYRGHSQFELLSVLDDNRMSGPAKSRLEELSSRFGDPCPGAESQDPQPPVAQIVEEPISSEAAMHISDDEWIHVLRTHRSDETTWDGHGPICNARELARTLGARAKDDPARFATLALGFDEEIPADAMVEVISNVAEGIGIDALAELCEHAHTTYGGAVGQTVCSAIRTAGTVNARLVNLVSAYADDPDPGREAAPIYANGGDLSNESLYIAGLNSTRGQAALAAASILFGGPDHLDKLLPVVEALSQDSILAVRVCAANAVIALMNHRLSFALDLAERLFDPSIGVLGAATSQGLLHYALIRDPDRFSPILATALTAAEDVASRAGYIWALQRQQGRLPTGISAELTALPTDARRGAAEAIADTFPSNAATSVDDLRHLLEDDDTDISGQATRAILRLDELSTTDAETLIDAVLASRTLPSQIDYLIGAIEQVHGELPNNTLAVCERAVQIAGAEFGDITSRSALTGHTLLTVVLRFYRQSDDQLRTSCLDIIDRLAEYNVIDIERALDDER